MSLKYNDKSNQAWDVAFHPKQNKPLDARSVVATKIDLTAQDTWGNTNAIKAYKGLQVFCEEDNTTYVFIGSNPKDVTAFANWKKVGSGDSGILLLDTEKLEDLDKTPNYYVKIPNPSELNDTTTIEKGVTVSTGAEGTYLDILFQAIRKLQTEVTRLSNTFKKGIVSYTDTNTASTQEFITSKEEEIQEPLWTISQDDMTTLEEVNLDNTGKSSFSPENNVSASEGTYLQIGGSATHDYSGEVSTDSYAQQSNYIIVQQFSQDNLECKNLLSNDTTIDYTSLYSFLKDKTRYNIFTLLGRHEKETSNGGSSYENYVYISITNSNDAVVKQGYLKDGVLQDTQYLFNTTDLLYFKQFTGANCYLYSLLTGSRDCGYSNYTDIPQAPDDSETFSYKAAHITIRSVKNKSTLESIKNRLLSNELIWVEDTSKLYILTNNNLIQIGSSTGGSDSDDSGKTDTMTDIAQWLKDENLITGESSGNYYLNSARLNDISSVTFKHEGSGKTFNISIQTDGTLKSREIKNNLQADKAPGTPEKKFRGAVARYTLEESDYTKTTIKVSTTTKDSTSVKGDRVRISKWYVPIQRQTTYNCSHDFIELANSGTVDYPLDNAYLHLCVVKKGDDGEWTTGDSIKYEDKVYKLSGYIPAQGTYLIRAKQRLDVNSDVAYIKVDSYDIELWNDLNELQDLCNVQAMIILNGVSAPQNFYKNTQEGTTLSIYDSSSGIRNDVVDVVVLNNSIKTSPFSDLSGATYKNTRSNTLQKDLYFLDPAKQAFKTLGVKIAAEASQTRTAKVDAENIVLNSDTIEFYHSSETKPVSLYKPHASYENANVCTDKSRLDINKPNAINCAFGINGWTTRCFNWVSVGENDEYIWIRKKEDSPSAWSKTNRFESYKGSDGNDSPTQSNSYPRKRIFSKNITTSIYARLTGNFPANGQHYTAHKIVLDITEHAVASTTTYEYIVGRSHMNGTPNLEHCSDIRTFTLYPTSYTPVVIQTTDQQGFTWMEYQTWAAAANYINDTEIKNSCFGESMTNFPVLLNTGDMTQNGTRVNEWLDYFNAAECLFSKYEFMHVVGNNDLVNSYNAEFLGTGDDDGKSSPYYFHVFFCYEVNDSLPSDFPNYVEDSEETTVAEGDIKGSDLLSFQKQWQHPLIYNNVYIPSLYYFGFPNSSNTGKGFLMVNSEITEITCGVYFQQNHLNSDNTIAKDPDATTCTYNLYTGRTGKIDDKNNYMKKDNWCLKQTIQDMLEQVQFKWNNTSQVPLKNVIVACHEMPFTVITADNLKKTQQKYDRSFDYASSSSNPSLVGSHLNVLSFKWLGFDETYWFSKLLQEKGIKLCIGGHKHSYCSTYPIHEYTGNEDVSEKSKDNHDSRKCTIYIAYPATYSTASESDYHAWNTSTDTAVNAVVYFMCQATGYKQKSNKELPGPAQWFSKILPDTNVQNSTADNTQCFPMYAVFTYEDAKINIALKRIANIQKEDRSNNSITQLNETSIVQKNMVAETCLLAWDKTTSKYKPYWYSTDTLASWLNRVSYTNGNWSCDGTSINDDFQNPLGSWNNTAPITDSVSLS